MGSTVTPPSSGGRCCRGSVSTRAPIAPRSASVRLVSPDALGPRTERHQVVHRRRLRYGGEQRGAGRVRGPDGVGAGRSGERDVPDQRSTLRRRRPGSAPIAPRRAGVAPRARRGVTVANAMVIAVRRRRRDIAILQSLGSTRGNVTAVGVWQGVTIGVTGLLFGVPLGVATGRWFWSRLANGFGTLAEPVVPLPGLVGARGRGARCSPPSRVWCRSGPGCDITRRRCCAVSEMANQTGRRAVVVGAGPNGSGGRHHAGPRRMGRDGVRGRRRGRAAARGPRS